jgi:nucleotide-binding universal stress UspA family protein
MIAFRHILCPTDFSPPSFQALETAVDLARYFSAELWVMHVIAPAPPPAPVADASFGLSFDLPLFQQELAASSEKALKDLMEQKIPKEVSAHPVLASGDPAREIIREAEDQSIDLIVIATHGLTGWGRLLFGSVAEKVVRLAPCPVLTIKGPRPEA